MFMKYFVRDSLVCGCSFGVQQ